MHKQPVNFFQDLQTTAEGFPTGEGHDYTANILWKDDEEFQEVLYYWSSWFRAIHMAKLSKPIETEFKSSWEWYYGAEVVSIILPGPV